MAATYAPPASNGDGSIRDTMVRGGRSGGVTSVQRRPSLRVMWMRPSSEPVQISPFLSGDSAMVYSVAFQLSPLLSRVSGPQ